MKGNMETSLWEVFRQDKMNTFGRKGALRYKQIDKKGELTRRKEKIENKD